MEDEEQVHVTYGGGFAIVHDVCGRRVQTYGCDASLWDVCDVRLRLLTNHLRRIVLQRRVRALENAVRRSGLSRLQ
jgi:hypothetical protein